MILTIFFDFDGVILDSVSVKTEAFRKMYLKYGQGTADAVVKHHLENGGMSRYEKFRLYHDLHLNIKLDKKKIENLADIFSSLVVQKVIDSKAIEGALEFIDQNYDKFNMYIVSGTPQNEMRRIIASLHIESRFKGVFGSPNQKQTHVDDIIKDCQYNREECVFIGDALADYNAAQENEVKFILVENSNNTDLFKGVNHIYRMQNLLNLKAFLSEL
jgi:phosphoglycolate phosphatase-like HAD superfamily hydrolase